MALRERDGAWCEEVLAAGEVGWLAMGSSEGPYVVPVNYFWRRGRALVHTGLEGRKLDCLRADDRVCLGVGAAAEPLKPHERGGCYRPWRSVLVFGRARIVEEAREKLGPLQEFLDAYSTGGGRPSLTEADVEKTLLVIVEPERITGREETGEEG
jgi:nitroimidazol reductase NimA-like FMN-containing flavoprotein (pyridoxamine 5'-phosphate oxidase superfamily)